MSIGKAAQTIVFTNPGDKTFSPGGTVALAATGGASGNPVTFASTTASVCTVSGSTATMVGAGTCSIKASQAGNANYNAAPNVTQSFNIGKVAQTISFTNPGSQTYSPGGTVALAATGGASGNPLTFASTTASVCSVSGSTVTMLAAGTCSIKASQAGNANFEPATNVTKSFNIGKAPQAISFTNPGDKTFSPGGTVALTASGGASGNPVTFASTTAAVCTVSGGTATMVSAGSCSIKASQAGTANYDAAPNVTQSFNIDKALTTVGLVSSPNPSNSGQSVKFLANVQPTAATGTVTFKDGTTMLATVAVASGAAQLQLSSLTPGTHTITAHFSGDTNYQGSTSPAVSQTVINTGKLILKVVTVDDDGAFKFSSSAPALNLTLTTSGHTAQSAPIDLVAGTYSVAIAPPSGFGLTSIACSDGDSTGTPASKLITINITPSENVTCTVGAANSAKKTAGIIGKFMGKRADMMLSQGPDGGRQIDRLIDHNSAPDNTGAPGETKTASALIPPAPKVGGGRGSFEQRMSDIRGDNGVEGSSEGSSSLSFSTSLSKAMSLGAKTRPDGSPVAAPAKKSLFDIWTEVRYTSFDDARGGVDTGGHFGIAYLGADYIVSRNLLVGVLAQVDDMAETSGTGGYKISGKGWMAGPYATLKLSDHVYLQSRAAWGKSDNLVSPYGTYGDHFTTTRWLASAALVGHWAFGNWQLRPTASVAMMEDTSVSYVDSLGVTIPGVKVSLGQFKAGPEVSYRYTLPSGTVIEPRLGAHVIWNFHGSELPVDLGGTLTGPEGVRGRIEVGLGLKLYDGVMIDLGAAYDGIGSGDFSAVTGKATVRVPLN